MNYKIAIDSGGTFTDIVALDDNGNVVMTKAHTTPEDVSIGTMNAINEMANKLGIEISELLGQTKTIVHGTTQATNLVVNHRGARMGGLFTKGYRDRLTFLHVSKSDMSGELTEDTGRMFDFNMDFPEQLAERYYMLDVGERLDRTGEVMIPLNEDDVRKAAAFFKKDKIESVAVCLLYSHINPAHELRIGEILAEEYPELQVSLSHQVLPVLGEVSRWSTTMFDAYVAPLIRDYVDRIKKKLNDTGFAGELVFMQSNGGVAAAEVIINTPSKLIASGPAAGPSTAIALGGKHGIDNLLSIDMGGTSFDAAVIPDGKINVRRNNVIDNKKFSMPCVDVSAIGAGGGSIAWIDSAGRLQVGPNSAGAAPGPACYDQGGTLPTVTDANVVLGYIDPGFFLGGRTPLNKDLSVKAIKEHVADPLSISVEEAAAAIYDITNNKMAGALELVFSRRGYDPRDFMIIGAGGASAVHAARLQAEIGIKGFMIPKVAPVYCAYGMLFADIKHDYARPYVAEVAHVDFEAINKLYTDMETEIKDILTKEGISTEDIIFEKGADMRYFGQFQELSVKIPDGPVTAETLRTGELNFHDLHKKILGYSQDGFPTQIIRLTLAGLFKTNVPVIKPIEAGGEDPSAALKGTRKAYFSELKGFVDTPIYDGDKLLSGNILSGHCIIEEVMTTVIVPPEYKMQVDDFGNYLKV